MTIPRIKIKYSEDQGPRLRSNGLSVLVKNVNLGYFFSDKNTNNGNWNDINNWWLDPELQIQAQQLPTANDNITIYSNVILNSNPLEIPTVNNLILSDDADITVPIIVNDLSINNYSPSNRSFNFVVVSGNILPTKCPSANYAGILAPNGIYYGGARWKDGIVELTTDVGTNGGSSYYGTYDQTGNVWEITDTAYTTGINAGIKICSGGSYRSRPESLTGLLGFFSFIGYGTKDNDIGFRIVTTEDPYAYATGIMISGINNFVSVTNPNNSGNPIISGFADWTDTYGLGAITYNYKILKYPVTNFEYCKFLNSVDPDGLDQQSLRKHLYNEFMSSDKDIYMGGIDLITNAPKGQKYKPATNMAFKPVVHVNWYNAARMCNWLHNGAPIFDNTNSDSIQSYNSGIYLDGRLAPFGDLITNINDIKYVEPKYRIPQFNEWYKAGFYEESVSFTGYYPYAMRSFTLPVPVSANSTGSGIIPKDCLESLNHIPSLLDACSHYDFLDDTKYYFFAQGGGTGEFYSWFNIYNWWLDSNHTVQSPIFPDERAAVYIQSNVVYSGTVSTKIVTEYDSKYGPQNRTQTVINPIKIKSLIASGCSVTADIECSAYASFIDYAGFADRFSINVPTDRLYKPSLTAPLINFFQNSINAGKLYADQINFYGPYEALYASGPNNIPLYYGYFPTSCNGAGAGSHAPETTIYGQSLPDKKSINNGLIVKGDVNFYDNCINGDGGIILSVANALAMAFFFSDTDKEIRAYIIQEYAKNPNLSFTKRIQFKGYSSNGNEGKIISEGTDLVFETFAFNHGVLWLCQSKHLITGNFNNYGIINLIGTNKTIIKGMNHGIIKAAAPNTALITTDLTCTSGSALSFPCLTCGIYASRLLAGDDVSVTAAGLYLLDSAVTSGTLSATSVATYGNTNIGGPYLQVSLLEDFLSLKMYDNSSLSIDSFKNHRYHYDHSGISYRYNTATQTYDAYPLEYSVPVGTWPNSCETLSILCYVTGNNGFCFPVEILTASGTFDPCPPPGGV